MSTPKELVCTWNPNCTVCIHGHNIDDPNPCEKCKEIHGSQQEIPIMQPDQECIPEILVINQNL